MPFTERELLARMIQCEAGGEGEDGMRAAATVIMNRANVPYGEFFRVSNGGNIRDIMLQAGQFVCAYTNIDGQYNEQNIYNMRPEEIHYEIADWALAGNVFSPVGNSLFYFNPYSPECTTYFPPNETGVFYSRINNHCFYAPTQVYAKN